MLNEGKTKLYVSGQKRCHALHILEEICLLQLYQEVNDLFRSNTCCDDENERVSGNTGLPEQHFSIQRKRRTEKMFVHLFISLYT
jgi:hypothetical protein